VKLRYPVRLVISVPESRDVIVGKLEELAQLATLNVSVAEEHVPVPAVPLNHCFVQRRKRQRGESTEICLVFIKH